MAEATASNEKIHEALELLNQAAKEKKDELRKLMSGKYEHAKEAIAGAMEKPTAWVHDTSLAVGHAAVRAEAAAVDTARAAAATVDESAHKHPWPYIGGALVCGFLVGMIVSHRH